MSPKEAEDAKVVEDLRSLGRYVDKQLPFGWGWVVLAFPFGADARMNYISNAERSDVVRAMYEFIEATKGKWSEHVPEESSAAEDEQLGRARQRIAALERQHEEMLLKHVKEQNIALELLQEALKQISQLREFVQYVALREDGSNYEALRRRAKSALEGE